MTEHSFLFNFLIAHPILSYGIAFITLVFEGDAPLFLFGFLTQQGVFNPYIVFVFLYTGTVVGDAMCYFVGIYGTRFPLLVRWANKLASPLDDHLRERPFRTIFFSQFVYGIHHAIWIRAGLLRLPVKRLVKIDIFSSIFWVLIIGGLGYAASATLLPIGKYVKYAEILLLFGFIIYLVIQHYLTKLSKKTI